MTSHNQRRTDRAGSNTSPCFRGMTIEGDDGEHIPVCGGINVRAAQTSISLFCFQTKDLSQLVSALGAYEKVKRREGGVQQLVADHELRKGGMRVINDLVFTDKHIRLADGANWPSATPREIDAVNQASRLAASSAYLHSLRSARPRPHGCSPSSACATRPAPESSLRRGGARLPSGPRQGTRLTVRSP